MTTQRGIALLELLVGAALLSMSLLVLWGWQVRHLQQQEGALQQLEALALAHRLSEQLQGLARGDGQVTALHSTVLGWTWDSPLLDPMDCRTAPCEGLAWQQSLMANWQQAVGDALPSGQSQLVAVSDSEWLIQIRWTSVGTQNAGALGATCRAHSACLSQHVSW